MEIPCKECISLAICRHKYFIDMKNQCSTIEAFLFYRSDVHYTVRDIRKQDFDERIYAISDLIKPVKWLKKAIVTDVVERNTRIDEDTM